VVVGLNRQSLFGPSWQVQPELAIDTSQALMAPVMTRIPEPIHTFQEAPATLGRDERREPRNYRRIMPSPVHDGAVVCGPAQADCL